MKSLVIRYWSILSISIMIVSAGWIWLSKSPPAVTTGGRIPAPQKGFLAPDFNLESSSGQKISLSEMRGRPVLVNFWASWCAPCRAEMPAMERAYQRNRSRDFVTLAVNATYQDDPSSALRFGEELGLSFPILFDRDGTVSNLYQVNALPTSFFIDRDGIIREVVIGGPMSEALLFIRVEELIGNPARQAPK